MGTIAFDLDGTIIDTSLQEKDFLYWYEKVARLGKYNGRVVHGMQCAKDIFPDVAPEVFRDFDSYIERFWHSRYPLKPGVTELFSWLKEKGHKVFIITSRGADIWGGSTFDEVKEDTIKCLQPIVDFIDGVYMGIPSNEKIDVCKECGVTVYVDDSPTVLESAKDSEVKMIIADNVYNREFDGIRVSSYCPAFFVDALEQVGGLD